MGTIIGLKSLTTVFGMGTGVSFSVCSPEEERRTGRHGALNLDLLQEMADGGVGVERSEFRIVILRSAAYRRRPSSQG